jgi:hypothetical protein
MISEFFEGFFGFGECLKEIQEKLWLQCDICAVE